MSAKRSEAQSGGASLGRRGEQVERVEQRCISNRSRN